MNGNNLALIPHGISKTLAAAEMIRRHYAQVGRVPTLGMGDSISDLGFMRLCDFAAFPPHSQLDRHIP
jgi:phosphoserine phosphatase